MNTGKVALELYTVRDQTQIHFASTIRQVAAMGYAGVEFAGYGGLSAQSMSDLLAETGLQVAGTHVGLAELYPEHLDASIEYCRAIGCPALVLPWLTSEWYKMENLSKLSTLLNTIGQHCVEAGLTFAYHNHAIELTTVNGQIWLDQLFAATDPALVKSELDVYWVAYAGHEPLSLLQRLGKRVALIHFKDMADDRSMTEVGKGRLDMQGITRFAQQQDIWAIVEHDNPTLPSLESACISLEYFQKQI